MFGRKLLILCVAVCFAMFLGVDLATKGIRDINGPIGAAPAETPVITPPAEPASLPVVEPQVPAEETVVQPDPATQLPPVNPHAMISGTESTTLVNKVADSTGSLLRNTANKGVELFVSLFDGITGE